MSAQIQISQTPTRYNLAVSPNVWTLEDITSNEDAYVLQVQTYTESTGTFTTIATIQQPANPAGVAHFDVSKILQAQLDIAFVEETEQVSETASTIVAYRVRGGSTTNDVITYDDTSTVFYAVNGYLPWREMNWASSKFVTNPLAVLCEGINQYIDADYPGRYEYLTNAPDVISVRSSTWHTLSFFNRIGNYDNGTQWNNSEQPYAIRIKMYDIDDTLIQTTIYEIAETTGLGPRPQFDSNSAYVWNNNKWIGTVGVGPQNLIEAGYWVQSTPAKWNLVTQVWGNYSQIWNLAVTSAVVDHYTVEVCSINMCYWDANGAPADNAALTLEPYLGDVIYTRQFQVADPCTGYDPITVSFVNQYGVKDYYTFDRRNTWTQSIQRNNYDQVLGSWSATTFEIDPHGRGTRTFSTKIMTNMTMSSYWMDDDESKWLEELFTSPHIQVYYDGVWEPAVITSNKYEQKTAARNGLFQHTLTVQFANNKRVQRG